MDKTVHIIGFPMDLGSGRRGVDMGPSALRIAGLTEKIQSLGYSVIDEGDIPVANQETCEIYSEKLKFLPAIKQANELLAQKVESILDNNGFPLIIGGDHAMGIGTIAGISGHCKKHGKTLGVLWIDAHADMNTPETTPSGNIHGMPLAVSMGYGAEELVNLHYPGQKIKPEHLIIIGARSIDPGERDFIREVGVTTHTMGTPVPGGLSYREAHLLMEMAAESGLVSSFEVSEVNPILDDKNASAVFATDIVASCMGKRIL